MSNTLVKSSWLLIVLMLSGCQQVYNNIADSVYEAEFSNISLYYGDFSGIKDMNQISFWMRRRVTWKYTRSIQSPKETLERGTGDCDGYALLYMNIAYVLFNVKCDLVLTDLDDRKIKEGGTIDHAVVRLPSGKLIDAESGWEYNGPICYIYSFDTVFK